MTILFTIGRIIFAFYWLENAYSHFMHASSLAGYTQAKTGVKSLGTAKLGVIATGILLLVGGLTILTGDWVRLGILCLVVFLLLAAFVMHAYWKETDPMAKMNERISFWKDLALLAGLLMLLAVPTPWPVWTL